MRTLVEANGFRVKAVIGTHVVLMALDCDEAQRKGLLGFGIQRKPAIGHHSWLRSQKVFGSVVPDPKVDPKHPGHRPWFSTEDHPIQSFLWSDYTVLPDTDYTFTIVPMYGKPGALVKGKGLVLDVHSEKESAHGHGIWFNRGAIASQAFAEEFDNVGPNPPDNPDPASPETQWLSRGLLEACLRYIGAASKGEGLRVAAYEFTYAPILDALKAALDRGVDVQIVYHDTSKSDGEEHGANEAAIMAARLPAKVGGHKVLFPRHVDSPGIPHNKFIVRLNTDKKPTQVWTGSTNFTPSGFLGQTNVGHVVVDAEVAATYLAYWKLLSGDPLLDAAREGAMALTPDPSAVIPADSVVPFFSPRTRSVQLQWYGDRVGDAVNQAAITIPFSLDTHLADALAADSETLRFVLMEKPPSVTLRQKLVKNRDVEIAFGDILGETYVFDKKGEPTGKRVGIKEFELDKWFLKEDHFRHAGFVFFIHTKFLLIDPLSDDPLVCTGSANFSPNSLLRNDENMLLIRGDTRVADIYLTEFDRIFRHFFARNAANKIAAGGGDVRRSEFLDETPTWSDVFFKPDSFKCRRREMFFADPAKSWVTAAAKEKAPA
ncbi:phosphatidylserine/phosphatidylglycerophosphate/cardiolipin synthase-like enzyme [Mycobacterium sp. BK086]|uniref:phospholipase D-like domain-containing protein n=1 Tax=Mycobacterium sp. BK086 TaxID=2512165 RepID=UPI00105DC47A|nr:phospholipase D-like domain-containing protein [Mycobacterium sp. BK086]TDO06484.1 phosphatidylserine/phosphatidylglycerophosphate/cardiolipin synthase-like enzyme [Mycobacterium sp. BK086]